METNKPSVYDMMGAVFSDPDKRKAPEAPFDGPKYGRPRKPTGPRTLGDMGAIARVQKIFEQAAPVKVKPPGKDGTGGALDLEGAWGKPDAK